MRERRRALDPGQRERAALSLIDSIIGLSEYRNAEHLAVYVAMDGEIDPAPLVTHARAAGKQLYLPVLSSETEATLHFARWQTDTVLHPNRFNIPEPSSRPDQLHPATDLDLVLTPLVAFDTRGHRLGMGGGYYDRSFAFLKSGASKPVLIGLAYAFQQLPTLEVESWDIPLAGVATDAGFYRFRN